MDRDIQDQINKLKKDKNAVIMAHYYAPADVQALADCVGDSFYLAKKATETNADIIVFCGVGFMGESVKILNPDKTVLVPDITADCPMAHMADPEKIMQMRKIYPDLEVVCYINSTAALKCCSDVCVTSANAERIVKKLPGNNIFFIPDKNLGSYIAQKVPEKNIMLNDGYCPVHASLDASQVQKAKSEHPGAKVLAHPECSGEVLSLADYIGSTSGILDYAEKSGDNEFIICTEQGIDYPLNKAEGKKFWFAGNCLVCSDMKLNTPEKILHVLKTGENSLQIDEETRQKALRPLKRMLELAK